MQKSITRKQFLMNNVNANISQRFFRAVALILLMSCHICFLPEIQDFYLATKPDRSIAVTEAAEDTGMYNLLKTR